MLAHDLGRRLCGALVITSCLAAPGCHRAAEPAAAEAEPAAPPLTEEGDNGTIAWDVTTELVEDMINDVLGPGLFTQVRLAVERETGKMRGFGHIDFKDAASAERCLRRTTTGAPGLSCRGSPQRTPARTRLTLRVLGSSVHLRCCYCYCYCYYYRNGYCYCRRYHL